MLKAVLAMICQPTLIRPAATRDVTNGVVTVRVDQSTETAASLASSAASASAATSSETPRLKKTEDEADGRYHRHGEADTTDLGANALASQAVPVRIRHHDRIVADKCVGAGRLAGRVGCQETT